MSPQEPFSQPNSNTLMETTLIPLTIQEPLVQSIGAGVVLNTKGIKILINSDEKVHAYLEGQISISNALLM